MDNLGMTIHKPTVRQTGIHTQLQMKFYSKFSTASKPEGITV